MLGAEGVKTAVLTRLDMMMPVSLAVRRAISGARVEELPEIRRYFPHADVPEPTVDMFPLITVTAEGTNGELSNEQRNVGGVITEFHMEYSIMVRLYALVESQAGDAQARLQVERLALAAREALLGDQELDVPGDDEATVEFERWAEEYDVSGSPESGVWEAQATLVVPVATVEYLDRAPYINARKAVLESWDVEKVPTSTAFPPKAA